MLHYDLFVSLKLCQDLSLAGKRQGMAISQAEGGTRSGLLWEVERILDELTERPQVLLMENVPEVIGAGNVNHFNKWLEKLETLGYTNHFKTLNAKDYGIPQNRRRVFMVSILGDYAYDFPIKIKLKYRLKDFLEKKVDEKYYLSDKDIERISNWCSQEKPLENAIDVEQDNDKHSGMKLVKVGKENGIMVKENTLQGYKIAKCGDGVNLASRMKHQRGNVQAGSIQTLKAEMEIGVVVGEDEQEN